MDAILCCAACLHAIVAPASPVLAEGRYFHLDHLPADALDAVPVL